MLFKSLLFASTATATCLHGLTNFKRDTAAVEAAGFGYGASNGPFVWASLAPENEACKTGVNQSPINIDASIRPATGRPTVNIPRQSVDFLNLGTTIEVVVNGTTRFNGADYRLRQFHMHTPSEHHINDEFYPLEVHMVHQGVRDTTQLAVIALMFQVAASDSDPLIAGLSSSLARITTPGSNTTISSGLDFSSVLNNIRTSDILQYSGSLTTPPCAEGVTFLIVKNPLDIGVEDFNAIKKIVKFNSRFIQNTLGQENILTVGGNSGSAPAQARASGIAIGLDLN